MIDKSMLPDWVESAEGFTALANDCIPIYEPGGTITGHCALAVRGKRFVKVSGEPTSSLIALDNTSEGGNISTAECTVQGEATLGVANRDIAAGGKVGVLGTPGLIVPVTAGAAVAAAQEVMTDNQGRAIPYVAGAGIRAAGVCIQGAAGVGIDCVVRIYGAPVRGAGA